MSSPITTALARFKHSDGSIAVVVFLAAFTIFFASPLSYVSDSKYSLLLSHNLLARHSLILDGYVPRAPILVRSGSADLNGRMYQMEVINDHLYYYFPPGTSILTTPFVAVMEAFGKSVLDAQGNYSFDNESSLQSMAAAILMAALVVIFYLTARLLLPTAWSLCLAGGGALGTQVWSTASRGLWTHTWGILLVGWAIYLLLAQDTGRRRISAPLLASLLSWSYFVRPTNSIFIIGFTVYILLFHRSLFIAYAVTGAAWFGAFVAYSWYNFHHILPTYYQANRLSSGQFAEAVPGNLISPSRGMLVDAPVVLFVAYLVVRYWKQQPFPRLVCLALLMSAAHLAAVSCFTPWFGGVCFGPRYTTEIVPWVMLLAVLGTRAMLDRAREPSTAAGPGLVPRGALGVGAVLLAASIFINGRGAVAADTAHWNQKPVEIDEKPWRVWDWSQVQFLAGLVRWPVPDVFAKLAENRIEFGHEAAKPFEGIGWSDSEPTFCWTNGKEADLYFATDDTSATRIRFKTGVYFSHRLNKQHLNIELNGRRIASLVLTKGDPEEYSVDVPKGALRSKNTLFLRLPDADSPLVMEKKPDARLLGLAIQWLEFSSPNPDVPTGSPSINP